HWRRRRLEVWVIGLFDIGKVAGVGTVLAVVGEIGCLELGRIEIEAAALGPRRGPGDEGGSRHRIVVARDFGFRAAGGETCGTAAAAAQQPSSDQHRSSGQGLRESMHSMSPLASVL